MPLVVLVAAGVVAVGVRAPHPRHLLTAAGPTTSSPSTTNTSTTTSTTSSTTPTTSTPTPAPTTTAPPPDTTGSSAPAPVSYPGAPKDLTPLAGGTYSGEGHWVPAGRFVGDGPAVWVTTLRPPSGGNAAGVASLDTSRLTVVPYAGTTQPGGTWSNQGSISPERQHTLVAAFNGGFQFNSSQGGFFADGHAYPALRDGAASLVEFLDGSAIVGQWGRDVGGGPFVISVRQNLVLLVDNGAPVSSASDTSAWGATLGGVTNTWRSGVGSDDSGHLYFVGGPGLSAWDLATVLAAAGSRRAMELDINPQWVLFASFTDSASAPNQTYGAKLLGSMNYDADHFFYPDWRDFVAVFAKPPAKPIPPPKGQQ